MMGTLTLHTLDIRDGSDDGYIGNPYVQPSGGDTPTPTPTPTTPINTTDVYDAALGATQAALNQTFNAKSNVQVRVQGTTLVITTT